MARRFRFTGEWQVAAPVDAVADVLVDLAAYPTWWPEVRAVATLGPEDARVLCRSRLPYTLDLVLHATSTTPPLLEVSVTGDLDGWVAWRLAETPTGTHLALDQEVAVASRALRAAAWAARPLLAWNHEQMMRSGIAGLRERLRR